eukprot:TRINITY_DN4482_c1_g1_i1.p1 TRINITY_DN4482_c1_g1~~TRINITY_DN4482_c1_g1_i1.p1  ORF type:complete len:322 (+),score=58.63 TRINITY_DN4482_c1_g1_i1:520-1485(+)
MGNARHPLYVLYTLYNSMAELIRLFTSKATRRVSVLNIADARPSLSPRMLSQSSDQQQQQQQQQQPQEVIDYTSLVRSFAYHKFTLETCELQRVQLGQLTLPELKTFFVVMHNMLAVHAHFVMASAPSNLVDRRLVTDHCFYNVGGSLYSPTLIETHMLLGSVKFPPHDPRFKLQVLSLSSDPVSILLALSDGTRSSPSQLPYIPKHLSTQIEQTARAFFKRTVMVKVQEAEVILPFFCKRYYREFGGSPMAVLRTLLPFFTPTQRQQVAELMDTESSVGIDVTYGPYDWAVDYPCLVLAHDSILEVIDETLALPLVLIHK